MYILICNIIKLALVVDLHFLHANFLRKTIFNKMFHSDYKHITDRLPDSLVKRAYQGLLNHSKNPVPLEMISGKSGRIESYLRHKLEVYENSLNRKCKSMAQEKLLRPRSWSECNVFPASPAIYVTDNGTKPLILLGRRC